MSTLSNILKINAISSGITGLQLVALPKLFANLFEINILSPFIITGSFLIVFSLFVLNQAYQKPIKTNKVVSIIYMDALWVVISLIVVPVLFNTISIIGSIIIVVVAAWVALMAYLQNAKVIRVRR